MTLEIKVGPPQLAVHQGYTVMVSDPDGQILQKGDQGLYFLDTRLISAYALFADGVPWTFLNGGALAASAARIYCTNPPIRTADGMVPERTLGLVFGRHLDGGMHEDVDITNYGRDPVCINLEIAIRSDFADLFEVKGKTVTRKGKIRTDWSNEGQELTTTYRHVDFSRAPRLAAGDQHSAMVYANRRLSFAVELQPGAAWHTSLLHSFADGDRWSTAPTFSVSDYMASEATRAQKLWQASVLKVETSNVVFADAFARAIDDMSALRLPIEGTDHAAFVPADGLPWFSP